MKLKILTATLFLSVISTAKSEEAYFADLFVLVHECPTIFTAVLLPGSEYIDKPDGQYLPSTTIRRFLIKDRIKTGKTVLPDTIQVSSWENYIIEDQTNWITGEKEAFSIDSVQVFIFFGTFHVQDKYQIKNSFRPLHSGIRFFRNDSMYIAYQPQNPGPYHLRFGEKTTLPDFIEKTYRTMNRLDNVLTLRQIRPLSERNRVVLEWVELHKEDLLTSKGSFIFYEGDSEKNWGKLKWEIFELISESGIWQDIWKAMEISASVVVFPEYQYSFSYRPGESINAFSNTNARFFLCEKITDINLNPILINSALHILNHSIYSRVVRPNVFALNQPEQKELICSAAKVAYSHNNVSDVQIYYIFSIALEIIESASFPENSDLPPFYDESVLFLLKSNSILKTENPKKDQLIKIIQRMEQSKR